MTLTRQNYIGYLLIQVPTFEPIYQAHILLYEERLDYPLWGDIFRYAKHLFETHQTAVLADLLDFLNQVAETPDDDLVDIFHTSFLEYIPHADLSSPEFEAFLLGHLNAAALQRYQQITAV